MLTASRKIPVRVTFLVVLGVVIALIIFFGAWAVSVDVGNQRTLAFGLPGTTPSLGGSNIRGGNPEGSAGPYQVARLDDNVAGGTWWGQAFLKACPLH